MAKIKYMGLAKAENRLKKKPVSLNVWRIQDGPVQNRSLNFLKLS